MIYQFNIRDKDGNLIDYFTMSDDTYRFIFRKRIKENLKSSEPLSKVILGDKKKSIPLIDFVQIYNEGWKNATGDWKNPGDSICRMVIQTRSEFECLILRLPATADNFSVELKATPTYSFAYDATKLVPKINEFTNEIAKGVLNKPKDPGTIKVMRELIAAANAYIEAATPIPRKKKGETKESK